ncbi:3,4-dihydroxy-2-butanone-4-phosphate synthase, partial [Vibrio anguillarum]|nr:3,4-dihydroxy-2-butanone-4-phosphate synthase [Vibrio anguillarum]
GSMAKTPEIVAFGQKHNMPVLTIEDMVLYRTRFDLKLA